MTTTQLTPAQHAILAHAVEHSSGKIDWFSDNIKGGARKKVLDGMFNRAVDTIFGYSGGAVLPLYDVIYSFEGIRHILGRHEQGCVHEAEGYAKSTGKIRVAVVMKDLVVI